MALLSGRMFVLGENEQKFANCMKCKAKKKEKREYHVICGEISSCAELFKGTASSRWNLCETLLKAGERTAFFLQELPV